MKANEIQIGDWVYCFDPDESNDKQINKVSAVRVEYNEGTIKFEQFTDWFEEGWFEPIPLTAEILEKNGWRYDSELNNWWHEGAEFLIWHDEKIGFYCCNITTITLNEVHRLQHLLRLCGLNELADNFKI